MPPETNRARVGLTVLAALVVFAAGVLIIGDQTLLFSKTNSYSVQFLNVGGLATGSPVQLNGVTAGRVGRIVLSEDINSDRIRVWVEVERRYSNRIREDSVARIKSLGLLGDKFIVVTSGSPATPAVAPGGEIKADQPTDVDALIQSGEDVAGKVVATAQSLANILQRMERGEGLLGELVAEREGRSVTESILRTLESVEGVAARLESGEGAVGRLINDRDLADSVTRSVQRLDHILDRVENGTGPIARLLNDPQLADDVSESLTSVKATLSDLGEVVAQLKGNEALLPRLLNDEEYGRRLTEELESILHKVDEATGKLVEGDGTVSQLVNDPAIYDALNDIVVGVDESKMLRWLIRNRQKAGIKKRYKEEQAGASRSPAPPLPQPASPPP